MSVDRPISIQPAGATRRLGLSVTPALELLVLGLAAVIAIASYFAISGSHAPQRLLTPALVALLLVANLLPGVALLVLLGRRVARRRAAASPIGGNGRLHVRLVALFSMIASIPMLLVTIFASFLFQYGVEFWFSDRARGMLENAAVIANESHNQMRGRVAAETTTMAGDLRDYLGQAPIDSQAFAAGFGSQVYHRELSEAAIFSVTAKNGIQTQALVNPYERRLEDKISLQAVARLRGGQQSIVTDTGDRIQALTAIPGNRDLFLYAARVADPQMLAQSSRAESVLADYRSLLKRSRSLQLQFNAALLVISLLIVGIAVFIALAVADRLVRPVGELVGAARRVAGGDLAARVPDPKRDDEVGTLAMAFNQMTAQLAEQTGALESRRALLEGVMLGVSAGIVSTDASGTIRVFNRSASMLLGTDQALGKPLGEVSPELSALLTDGTREAIVEIPTKGDPRTLAVRVAKIDQGAILTFDDITQQQLDQRRAAWADVARRIAHEIKNPLTPIQLAAERLQRRYGKTIDAADTTFARLIDTIVRQVGDLRRMVDEFSSFARMPKPVFREEAVLDIARQALFLHEVAHPAVKFTMTNDDPPPQLVCDRRQLGQALTNIVKNAVEAVEARQDGPAGAISMRVGTIAGRVEIEVCDNGVGLPVERDRIVEPYMTTRARGTGLGLAIVSKIVEEHLGTMTFADCDGGGTAVLMRFDPAALAVLDEGKTDETAQDSRPLALTRTGSN